mmetsp:Transcript_44575/g.135908  ORF Transcript_44575/g.135908 Transcript_44575/m.135908 type:complete len:486 (-) Transcript_44575:283-1740(-)|eukprot:CAMPEP_0113554814 /NCGR_PEP_ID=MMETSP0015_2-20120614/16365_1 /TAXON_ID=2838 /ORGANISM="Odontella" /LENGTH=485 /DNA_ID=CAMNT_0000456011 /DNA_START=122 /DNA_END=1579 /DNA_ORIENTATION=- /assembly_acc=CAM_ASM_000160
MRISPLCILLASAPGASAFVPPAARSAPSAPRGILAAAPRGGLDDESVTSPPPLGRSDDESSSLASSLRGAAVAAALSAAVFFGGTAGPLTGPPPAHAESYTSLTEEQKFVAEAWRLLDGSYLDRTFNGQDWFKVRQDAVKTKYKSMDEAKAAVDKVASSLGDKYTRYLTPNKYQSVVSAATGQIAGVGVEIAFGPGGEESGKIVASGVEDGSPAFKAGVKKGDVFMEADGERFDTGKATPDDVAARVRGPKGSKVGVVMERDGKTFDYIITREPIKITAVNSYMSSAKTQAGEKIGVIRIKNFSGTTVDTVKAALDDLKSKGASAIVLDVRNNPGGLLPGGVDTASLFLPQDVPVVFVVNKNKAVDAQSTYATGIDLDDPVVVFVNSNTASAAEVMTAALKENGRAVVVGDDVERTFGKGIVQTIRGLTGGMNGGVAITVSRYETPKKNDINKQGIQVDLKTTGGVCGNEDAAVCIPKEAFKKL